MKTSTITTTTSAAKKIAPTAKKVIKADKTEKPFGETKRAAKHADNTGVLVADLKTGGNTGLAITKYKFGVLSIHYKTKGGDSRALRIPGKAFAQHFNVSVTFNGVAFQIDKLSAK